MEGKQQQRVEANIVLLGADSVGKSVYSRTVRQQLRPIRRGRKPSDVPVVIVGNKRDFERHRNVSSEEGRLLALSGRRCCFFEVSAAEMYHGLIRESRAPRKSSVGARGIVQSTSARKKRAE